MVKTTEFNVQTQMNYVVGNMSGFTAAYTGMDNLSALISSLMTSYTTMAGTGRAAYLSLGAAISAVTLKTSEAYGEFERGMNIVKAISGSTTAQMQTLSQTANQFSSQFRMGIEDVNDGLVTLGRAGLTDVNNQIEVLRNGFQVAKLEGMDLASTLEDIVTTTSLLGGDIKSNTFGAETKEISNLLVATSLSGPLDVSDVIETLKFAGGSAAAAGATLNNEEGLHDLLGAIGAFSQKGVTGSIAGTALRAFITKPASQDQKVSDALAKLGLDAYSLWEKDPERGWHMKPIAEQIGMINKAMSKNHLTNLDRIEVWGDIVGNKMGQQMLKLDENRVKETTKDIEHQRNLDEIYQGTLTNFASQVERLSQIFQSISRNLGSGFASTLTPIVEFVANLADFINGIGNGLIFKIIAAAIGPLGLAGLAKGLQDFIYVLGALRENIKKSANQTIGSQDLWVTQRGVIEKRMDKGEQIFNHDDWSEFLKKDNKSSNSYKESNEEYQARMAKREEDYKKRQDKRDEDYKRRQDLKDEDYKRRQEQKDEEYRQNQEKRNQLYQENLKRLVNMSVGAHTVKVFGSVIYFDAPGSISSQDFPVTPMPEETAKIIAEGQKESATKASSQQEKVFTSYKHDMNNMIRQQGNIDTAFTNVDPYSITLRHDYDIENGIYTEEFLKTLVDIEMMMRSVMGTALTLDSESNLFYDSNDMNRDVTDLHITQDAISGIYEVFKQYGEQDMDANMFGRAIYREIGAMVDNFNKHKTYQHIFSRNDNGVVSVQEGQEKVFTEEILKRAIGFMGNHLLSSVPVDFVFKNKKDVFSKDELRSISLNQDDISLRTALNKGMEMRGFNAYMAGFDTDKMDKEMLNTLADKYLFTHLGLISQYIGTSEESGSLETIVNNMNTAFQALELDEITQQEFNNILTTVQTFSANIQEEMKLAGEKAVIGWRIGTGIWSPGYIYGYTAQEFNGLRALLRLFKSDIQVDGQRLGDTLINSFQSSLGKRATFNTLVDEWFDTGYISEKEKVALKSSNTKLSTLNKLDNLINDSNVDEIKARRFGEEKINPLYDRFGDRLPKVKKGQFVVIDTESNTMSDSAEKQITQYAQRSSAGENDSIINMYIDTENAIQEDASILTGITNTMKQPIPDNILQKVQSGILSQDQILAFKPVYDEARAYYKIVTDLLTAINSGKAIVAHNAAYDKSNIISNLTRVASQGLLNNKQFNVGGQMVGIYDAIEAIDKANWIDTEAEVNPYRNARKFNGDFVFGDDKAKTVRTKNSIVFQALTGLGIDPNKIHDAQYDTYMTYAIMEALVHSPLGKLLTGKTWEDNVTNDNEYGTNLVGEKTTLGRDYEEYAKDPDEYIKNAKNKGKYKAGKIGKPRRSRPSIENKEAFEENKNFVEDSYQEKEIGDRLNTFNFDNFKKQPTPDNPKNRKLYNQIEFLIKNSAFQALYAKYERDPDPLKTALEEWAVEPRAKGTIGSKFSGAYAKNILNHYGDRIEDMTLEDLEDSWENDNVGLEHLDFYQKPDTPTAKVLLQAIKNKISQPLLEEHSEIPNSILQTLQGTFLSQDQILETVKRAGINKETRKNIIYNGKPLEDIYNVVQGSMLSQHQILAIMGRGKFFTKNGTNIGYLDDEGEFQPIVDIEDLSDKDRGFVEKYMQQHGVSEVKAMEALSNEYFQSNEVVQDSLEDMVHPTGKGFSMKRTSKFQQDVMEYSEDSLSDLVNQYNKIMGEDVLTLTDDGNVTISSPFNRVQRLYSELRDMEELFYSRFKDGVYYISEQIGGKSITHGAYHTFDQLPGVRDKLDELNEMGYEYKFIKDINEVKEEMNMHIARSEAGGEIGRKADATLAKIKAENHFIKNVWDDDPKRYTVSKQFAKNYRDAQYDFDFDNPTNFNLMSNYVLKRHKYKMGYGASPREDIFNLMNKDVMNISKHASSFNYSKIEFYDAISEFPVFVQNMIQKIIVESNSFREAMTILGKKGVEGFRDGTRMRSPPAVITEFLEYIRELPDYVLASSAHFQQAASSFGKAFITGFEGSIQNIQFFTTLQENPALLSSLRYQMRLNNSSSPSSNIQKYFDEVGIKALDLSSLYNQGNITQTSYLDQLYKQIGIDLKKDLMTPQQFKSEIAKIKEDLFNRNITSAQAKTKAQQLTAQYEDDNRLRGIRERAVSDKQFVQSMKTLDAQYKNSAITLEEYIEETMRLMGVEEKRLMTEEELAKKLIDIKNSLAAGDITEAEAEQRSISLKNQQQDDEDTLKENKRKEDRLGGKLGGFWKMYYSGADKLSKLGGITGIANSIMSLTMHPLVMLGEMIVGWVRQLFDQMKQTEQEKIAKLSEISSNAESAFDEQQSKWEEAQSKDNEDFSNLSDNEKQDQMLTAMEQGREDFNNASGETKALIGKQNELISANNNLIQQKMNDWITGYNGLEANYTEFMEGSGMYGTSDEFGFMDFLESIVNPDKLIDNSNTRRLDALAESSIQIDTRVKNMEEFTEDYQKVMASMGIAHRSLLDIYNVRGIMKESELSGTFFDQSPSNKMRIGSPTLMSPEKLAGIMKQQEKILRRFENRYLRFTRAGTGRNSHIEVTLGEGSIHKLAQQLGLKDIEAAQVLAVHQLQRIQDVMINQVEPQLAQQTSEIYNHTYQLGEANNKSDVQSMFQNTMAKGILAIQMQVAQLVYKSIMEQALQDYQAETGDTNTNTVGLLLNKARDTTAENHELAKKFSARGWGSYLQSRDINALVNQGYTEEQAIQKLAQQKGVSVDQLTNAYAKSSYDELGKYGYNGTERWLANNARWIIPAAATAAGAIGGSILGPIGTIGGAEGGSLLGAAALSAMGLSEVTIGATGTALLGGAAGLGAGTVGSTIGAAGAQAFSNGITDFTDPFSAHTNEMMRSYANSIPLDSTIDALNDAQVAEDAEGDNGNTDDSDANKQRYVQLAICNKKAIPKLNVNLFKKAPTFTVLNKNFKLRDIKINTADKAKNIENSLKNAIIDVQERSDPKIIQDTEAEYDPVGATDDATNLPTGASLTK